MSRNTGRYNLVREDIDNEHIEYFDFESMTVVNNVTKGVDISSIDALTTLFDDEKELSEYVDKVDSDYSYTYKIIFTTNKSKEEKVLKIVWNDPTLSSFSKIADGKVDFTSDYNFNTFFSIISDIKDSRNGLAKRIVSSKKESFKLNDQNKKIVEVIASSRKEIPYKDLMDSFFEYKECRALYLNYKYNTIEYENTFQGQLEKIKKMLKGE